MEGKPELLAPAGSMEALHAAIANGADAVYLGMRKFGARAYSNNFDEAELEQAVFIAHAREVKVYVTVNTIVFQNELAEAQDQLRFLNSIGVDGVIVQDLALLDFAARTFEDMEAHCSTQMGIEDVEGARLCKSLGAKRVVIARETPVDEVRRIREQAQIPIEAFIHGALCISYSGNCIMSGLTGNRLGNRGRCIGSCRALYDVIDCTTGASLGKSFILSTRDLNTIEQVEELRGIDSLKIEGRMKEPAYVANVVSRYRMALDGGASAHDRELLNRTFNRQYTKGYLFGEDRVDITNPEKPNNYGYQIGRVAGKRRGAYKLELASELNQRDVIRIRHAGEDVNLSVAKLYDESGNLISSADSACFIKVKEELSPGDTVYKTKDVAYAKTLEGMLEGEFRRFPLDVKVYAYVGAPLVVEARAYGVSATYTGDEALEAANSNPTTVELVKRQFAKLNDTVFYLRDVEFEGGEAFASASALNAARKAVVEQLYQAKVAAKPRRVRATAEAARVDAAAATDRAGRKPLICAQVSNAEQYQAAKECGVDVVYYDNVVPRNGCEYVPRKGELLIGGMGGIEYYKDTNPFVADYSLNVVNAESYHVLKELGAERVTLSYEMNRTQIDELARAYAAKYGAAPDLEMIVYGRAPLLVTKYCPLKKLGQCGVCRKHRFELRDERGVFPIVSHENCNTTILNGKILNLLDEMAGISGISAFRLNFTLENADEVRRIVKIAKAKLSGESGEPAFNPETDTRGHFFKEIL